MPFNEDIFGNDPIDLVIRFHPNTVSAFNRFDLPISFEELKKRVHEKAFACYFQKVTETEHRIIVPLQSDGYQVEFIASWHGTTFSYEANTRGNHKTTVKEYIKVPDSDFIQEQCFIRIIDISQPYRAKDELETLYNRVLQLNIPVDIDINKENEIWFKYIDATQRIITKRQEPFAVKKYYALLPIGGEMEKANRFKFKVDLAIEENKEYRAVEEAMKKLDIQNIRFDNEGNVQLTIEEITRVLDPVLEREFNGIIIREKSLGCIIKIRPLSIHYQIKNDLNKLNWNLKVQGNFQKQEVYFSSPTNNNKQIRIPKEIIDKFELQRKGFYVRFKLIDANGIESFEDVHGKVESNLYGQWFEDKRQQFFNHIVEKRKQFYDKGFQSVSKPEIYEAYSIRVATEASFSDDFWKELKRDLYVLPFEVEYNEFSQTIFFDFTDQSELEQKINAIRNLGKFDLNYKPEGFKYKVKTKLISRKTHLDTLRERIEKLGGVEFEIDIPKQEQEAEEETPSRKPKREKRLPIGMLSRRESNIGTLIFTVSTRYKEQKKAVKKLLEITEGRLPIGQVFPNLTGDAVKIQWLREAVGKLTQPTDKPNGKPVNPKLKDFIFDSSKAEQIFDETKIEEGSTFWNEVAKSRISKTLNNSQIKAILSALYANDLCLLQGPPGTGKTTVISEIIWQHIRQNADNPSGYKILLTSETNLAVDNALEKLVGAETTIVKPLRFGKAEKFEEEGKKYSLDRIMRWVDETYENQSDYENEQLETDADGIEEEIEREDLSNNAVQRWMLNIGNRAQSQTNPKYAEVIRDWQIELAQPTKEIKTLFKDKYVKFANVIGSTCSSCGSQGFKRDYDSIFNAGFNARAASEIQFLIANKPTSRKIWELLEELGLDTEGYSRDDFAAILQTLAVKQHTYFDAVIMDEASKATPPEMVLPLCFGKKSIIIGDHKQLPPMINERDFREVLIEEAEDEKLANEIGNNYLKESQFKRLITNPKVSPTIRATFDVQYRMHSQIGSLIQQFYPELENGLICGIAAHENIEDLNNPASRHHGLYHEGFIKPHTHVIWVDVPEPETKDGTSRLNEMECETVKRVLKYLKQSEGFDDFQANWDKIKDIDKRKAEQEVGIISFYGNQIKKLKEVKKYAENDLKIPIRLNTVDKFQGMERNILIVSTVRSDLINDEATGKVVSNVKGREGGGYSPWGFADSPERLNVALSRARRLLIIVGNRQHFVNFRNKEGEAIYANVINQIRAENIINYKTLEKYK
jgi:superfamily I DNA and/or RNA helicase